MDELVDHGRDVAFAFQLGAVDLEEAEKAVLELGEEFGRKDPEIHRDRDIVFDLAKFFVEIVSFDEPAEIASDVEVFFDPGEETVADLADAAIDRAVIGKGIDDLVTDESAGEFLGGWGRIFQESGGLSVGIAPVEVIGIDHREGAVDFMAGGADGVSGAPRFFASFGDGEAFGEVVHFLKGVDDLDEMGKAVADFFFELGGEVLADDKNHLGEAGADGIEDGIIEDGFAMGAHRVNLF